jgi:hypothetical protein
MDKNYFWHNYYVTNDGLSYDYLYNVSRANIVNNDYPNILRWHEYFKDHTERIFLRFNPDWLGFVDEGTVDQLWHNAMNSWNNVNTEYPPFLDGEDTAIPAIEVIITDEPKYFVSSYTTAAQTYRIWEWDGSEGVYRAFYEKKNTPLYPSLPPDDISAVYFNKSSNFEGQWVDNPNPTEKGQVDIEFVMLHELGHVLGIWHRNDQPSVMNWEASQTTRNLYFIDKSAFCDLYLLPELTGIEDGTSIVGPTTLSKGQDINFIWTFYDRPPATFPGETNWKISLDHQTGSYLFYDNSDGEFSNTTGMYWDQTT